MTAAVELCLDEMIIHGQMCRGCFDKYKSYSDKTDRLYTATANSINDVIARLPQQCISELSTQHSTPDVNLSCSTRKRQRDNDADKALATKRSSSGLSIDTSSIYSMTLISIIII
jgi:hypothetical protein